MTRSAAINEPPPPGPAEPEFVVQRVGEHLLLAAAQRLVSQGLKDRVGAARRLIQSAPQHGIDLSCIWVTVARSEVGKRNCAVRQACLAIPGSGRTAMIFISEPMPLALGGEPGGNQGATSERMALLKAVTDHFAAVSKPDVRVLQALPEPTDAWAEAAFRGAGFTWVGDLEYRRRTIAPAEHQPSAKVVWPEGIRVVSVADLQPSQRDSTLLSVLDQSYADTKDCPELCGMRSTGDILASHFATGVFDPSLWFVVFSRKGNEETPCGCMLLSRVPEQRALELVYVGLAPSVRKLGLGVRLMQHAIWCAADPRIDAITCAVDCRNEPALRLYNQFAFSALGRRRAFVCSVPRAGGS